MQSIGDRYMDKINMKNLCFYGYHGAIAEENVLGQKFIVDCSLIVDLSDAGKSDDVLDTVHYGEAYNLIKNIVENASKKADEGKQIAKKMFDGYEHLNANIVSTVDIINDVSAASKEQQSGIEQINDAIAELDKATQENAAVAANASNIAKETNSMAQSIVDNANQKEFTGKKDFDLTITSTSQKVMTQEISSKRTKQVLTDKTAVKKTSKIIASKNDTDEWESF